jgi:hypothetical protein
MALKLSVGLNKPQLEAIQNLVAGMTVCLAWGRGVGKSKLMRICWWMLVAQYDRLKRPGTRGVKIIVLMPTLKQFKDVHGDGIVEDLEGDWSWLGGKIDHTRWSISFPGGSWIKPFPAAEYSSKKALGMRCDVICCDEVDDILAGVLYTVAVPWLSAIWSLNIKLFAGTPRKARQGLLYKYFKLGESDEPKHRTFWSSHATYRDVPEIVSAVVVNEARETTPEPIFKREWECDFDSAEGLVYGSAWDDRFHVREPPENARWTEFLIGGDAGSTDPGVLLLIGVLGHGNDAIAWVIDEVYETDRDVTWWVQQLQRLTKYRQGARLYHDPSAKQLVMEYKRYCPVKVEKVDNSIQDGIRSMLDRLQKRGDGDDAKAHLYVSPKCRATIWEFGAYKNKQDSLDPDHYLDSPIDRHNHAMDALRYAIHGRFGGYSSSLIRNGFESQGLGVP